MKQEFTIRQDYIDLLGKTVWILIRGESTIEIRKVKLNAIKITEQSNPFRICVDVECSDLSFVRVPLVNVFQTKQIAIEEMLRRCQKEEK